MAAKGKVEASQQKTSTSSTDVSFAPDNELVELVWENGQIMMQGQSSRSRKTPKSTTSNNFPFQSPKFHDKDIENQFANNLGKYRTVDSVYSDIATSVPSGGRGPSQDEDIVPWFNYPNEDNLQQDLCPDFLPELSGVTVNESPTRKSLSSMDKKDHCDQIVRDSHNVSVHNGVALEQGNASKLPFSRSTQLNSWSLPQGQTSVGSRISDINNDQAPSGLFCQMNMKNQDTGQPKCNSSFLNFSHFSRSAAMARANIQNASAFPTLGLKPLETKPLGEPNLCREDPIMNVTSHNHNLGGSIIKGVPNNEKASEPVGASSSVCSGNSVERASNDPTVNLKRKPCHDTEESECQSEDVEEESVGIKKAASARGGSGSKRSRAAEVHNLSERRRRDRINEKMRALQELIPNCNKADKASMLDEAIEYLKTLQLQVQILSMGAGMYMPPMMLPTGMQHLHMAHLPHFSPMGVGMGIGTNMLDMNGGSRGCSMIPMPHMQGARYPSPPISGPTTFQSMARANFPVFGHPSQGLPMSVAGASLVPLSARSPINPGTGMSAFPVGVNVEASNAALNMNSKDLTQNTDSQVTHSADASISVNQQSSQFQATTKEFDQPDLLPKNDQREDANGNSTKENDVVPSREANCD